MRKIKGKDKYFIKGNNNKFKYICQQFGREAKRKAFNQINKKRQLDKNSPFSQFEICKEINQIPVPSNQKQYNQTKQRKKAKNIFHKKLSHNSNKIDYQQTLPKIIHIQVKMGQSKSQNRKPLETTRVLYLCNLIKMKLNEYKCSRQAAISQKEKEILKGISMNQQMPRIQQNEIHQLSSIIEDYLNINAAETIIRKTDVIKDHALTINQSQGRLHSIKDLSPFIENICWSNMIFGMDCIAQFREDMVAYYGEDLEMSITSSTNIDDRVRRALAPAIIASYDDLSGYVNTFCVKYNITIEEFNQNVHCFQYIQNVQNSSFGFQNNSNANIYSQCNTTQSMQHYQNGFVPTNHYENQLLASNRLQSQTSGRSSPKEGKKSKLLFCY